jgi:hypothetical protein
MLEIEQSVGDRDAIIKIVLGPFCQDGNRQADISQIVAVARISDFTFHEQFQSNEYRLSAFWKDRHANWMRWFENEIEARYEATGGGLEIIADVLQDAFEDPKSFCLAFMSAVRESGNFDKEPYAIRPEQKERLSRFIERLAAKMNLQHPDMAASAIVLVIERTIARALMTGSLTEAQTARLLFQCLQHA